MSENLADIFECIVYCAKVGVIEAERGGSVHSAIEKIRELLEMAEKLEEKK